MNMNRRIFRSRYRPHLEMMEERVVPSSTGTFVEYPLNDQGVLPVRMAPGTDGNVWFTEFSHDRIGRITPSGHILELVLPNADSRPIGITPGPNDTVWFTEYSGNRIGRVDLATFDITEFDLPSDVAGPVDIATGGDGRIYFSVFSQNQVGRINTDGSDMQFFTVPGTGAGPGADVVDFPIGLVAGPDGNVWFTDQTTPQSAIGRITPDGIVVTFPTPTAKAFPIYITLGPDGNLWFTETEANQIGRINPTTTVIDEFPVPTPASMPRVITVGSDGNLWFTELYGNKIGEINTDGTIVQELTVPTPTSLPRGITTGSDGNLWFAESNANKIGKLILSPDAAVAGDSGTLPIVKIVNPATGAVKSTIMAYDPGFRGGVRVAVGDLTGDHVPDLVTAPGPTGGPDIRVFNGQTHALVREFMAYDMSFRGGVQVAVGDVNGDGVADIITGADIGGGPHVKVFNGATGAVLMSFYAYNPSFTGGVRVAAGDVNGDGHADIITGAGPGGGPHVVVYSGANGSVLRSFYAYDSAFRGGVHVSVGDTNGDGYSDVITGAGANGGPHVRVFSGFDNAVLQSFYAYNSSFTGGVRVGAGDVNGDGHADIITGGGLGGGSLVKIFDGGSLTTLDNFFAFGQNFAGGIFVGGR